MIDTHAHLNFKAFDKDLSDVISQAFESGLEAVIVPGSQIENSKVALRIAGDHSSIYAAVGVHPCHVMDLEGDWQERVIELAREPKVVAIGEVGLDFIRRSDANSKRQREVLHDFINIANNCKLPIIFHSRESEDELLDLIANNRPQYGSVLHCFCADKIIALRAVDLGMSVSFTGMISYPRNEDIREVAAILPHDRVMIETDSPYLPPQNKRGERCEPKDVIEVAKQIGQIWKKDVEYVDQATSSNAKAFFHI